MAGNSFGTLFKLTTFGESNGSAIGGVIDGCPAGLKIDFNSLKKDMIRRMPGQSKITTSRKEPDAVQFLSGIFEGVTTGTPLAFIIENTNQKSKDYSHIKDVYRPSHADYTFEKKFGHRDYRGGGRASARETACRVVAGAIAKQLIKNIKITAFVSSVGNININKPYQDLDFNKIEATIVRCPDLHVADKMIQKIEEVKKTGDTLGGTVMCVLQNVPIGLGEPKYNFINQY